MKVKTLLITFLSIFSLLACTQAEVLWEKAVKKINNQIGKYEVQIKDYEKKIVRLEEAYKSAYINSKTAAVSHEQLQAKVNAASATLSRATENKAKLDAILAKGAPYMTSKGKELTRAQLDRLTAQVTQQMKMASMKKTSNERMLRMGDNFGKKQGQVAEQLKSKISAAKSKLELMRAQITQLRAMEEQVKAQKAIEKSAFSNIDAEFNGLDNSLAELGAEMDFLDNQMEEMSKGPSGLNDTDVNLLDEL